MIITRRLRLITRHLGQRRLTLAETFMRFTSDSFEPTVLNTATFRRSAKPSFRGCACRKLKVC